MRRIAFFKFITDPFIEIYRFRYVLYRTTLISVRGTYAGSLLGVAWLVVGPLLLLGLYSIIYLVVFRLKPVGMSQFGYVLYVFSGLIPFLSFSAALNAGTTSLAMNKEVLLNTVYPPELVPIRTVLASSLTIVTGLSLVLVLCALDGRISFLMLWVPLIMALQVLFVAGVVWILSLANLVVRDVQQGLMFVTIALLIATPIAYTPDMIPSAMQPLIYLNPLAYFVVSYQHVMVLGLQPPPVMLLISAMFSLGSFCGAYWIFQKAKQVFFDYA